MPWQRIGEENRTDARRILAIDRKMLICDIRYPTEPCGKKVPSFFIGNMVNYTRNIVEYKLVTAVTEQDIHSKDNDSFVNLEEGSHAVRKIGETCVRLK